MAREYTLKLHAINISAEPHPQWTYRDIFKRIYALKRPVQIRGDRRALMTYLQPAMSGGTHIGYYGTISTFTEIDPDQPWINTETLKRAEEDETLEISIPESLRPNLVQFEFYFDFDNHIFAFQGTTRFILKRSEYKQSALSPRQMEAYFNKLFDDGVVLADLDSILATTVPDPDTLRRILKADNIRELSISISLPNPDNIADQRGQVAERLRRIRSKRKVETYTALDKQGIKPDEAIESAAKVAQFDGKVEARVKVGTHTELWSTSEHPFTKFVTISSDVHSESQRVRGEAATLARNLTRPE